MVWIALQGALHVRQGLGPLAALVVDHGQIVIGFRRAALVLQGLLEIGDGRLILLLVVVEDAPVQGRRSAPGHPDVFTGQKRFLAKGLFRLRADLLVVWALLLQ